MTTKKSVTVGPRQQLVDLNGDITNFDLTFTATSKNGENFDIIVIDQTTLDNNTALDFKHANGSLSGNIVSDKGVYQNYFLCLKSDKPCEVDISIDIKEIQPKPQITPSQQRSVGIHKHPDGTNWKAILFVVAIGGAVLLYYLFGRKNDQINNITNSQSIIPPTLPNIPVPVANFSTGGRESLMSRINKFQFD